VDEFVIAHSAVGEARRVSIPADIATCAECLAETADPQARRFRYALTNCTQCGPRFTIARQIPYDRAHTTMASFPMCEDCRREYEDPADRRFHAQPIACPACGPRVRLVDREGKVLDGDPFVHASALLVDGQILAVKGIGGYHLCCDATSSPAVRTLRARKRREEKPFAVMVKDLAGADALAELTADERALLTSSERPIVLVRRRGDANLAAEIAPGNPCLGVFVAYSPLHHLLLTEARRPLVMTSGNLSEEPIACDDDEARHRLGVIADAFLVHDRRIENPCDDSVARVMAGGPTVFRRARGYVPRPVRLGVTLARPVLACGAHLKNTFCLAQGADAFLGPHIGDLDNLATLSAYERSVERLLNFTGIVPEIVAHDLHPDYASTRFARERPEVIKIPVQHHHAHVAAAMAEHGLEGPVIGVAYDGTGLGPDGAAWGGEILLCERARFERLGTLRPMPLAGGDVAIRQPWRLALALLDDAFAGDPPLDAVPLFQRVGASEVALVRRMIAQRLNAPLAHGAGRYFDALAALGLGIPQAHFEGQLAMAWDFVADAAEAGRYPFVIDGEAPLTMDLRPLVREAVRELIAGISPSLISARFHNTLVAATAETVRIVLRRTGPLPVVLTGGCFQNARLTESLVRELGVPVHLHRQIPPGDGGLALGQAVVADAVSR
jgi:hydrogenase maturation protein HypF